MVCSRSSSPLGERITWSMVGWQEASVSQRMWRIAPDSAAEPLKPGSGPPAAGEVELLERPAALPRRAEGVPDEVAGAGPGAGRPEPVEAEPEEGDGHGEGERGEATKERQATHDTPPGVSGRRSVRRPP